MDIIYYPNTKIPDGTNICFRVWDFKVGKKFYLTADGGNVFVPERGVIPDECKFILGIPQQEFEDAVLALAAEIIMDR